MKEVTVNAEDLLAVLLALNGPDHYLKELMVVGELTGNDPIKNLTDQYNKAVEEYNKSLTTQ